MLKREECNLGPVTECFELVHICVCESLCVCVFESVGVFLDVEGCM